MALQHNYLRCLCSTCFCSSPEFHISSFAPTQVCQHVTFIFQIKLFFESLFPLSYLSEGTPVLKAVNYFRKKVPLQMFYWVVNASLSPWRKLKCGICFFCCFVLYGIISPGIYLARYFIECLVPFGCFFAQKCAAAPSDYTPPIQLKQLLIS